MSLESTIEEITTRLREGRFANEQTISQGIVLRLLQELDWDIYDTTSVWPEYQTGEGRVDYALCHPLRKPAVFTEVKQPGKAEDAVRQALAYAFHSGVPLVVLTDGRTWSFYLPAEQGSYEDRRVHKLDLYERPAAEAAQILRRYLERGRIESGEALEEARKEYRSRNRRVQAKTAIPEAWRELVEKGDEQLVEIVSNAVESKTGVRPEADDVAEFLARLGRLSAPPWTGGDDGGQDRDDKGVERPPKPRRGGVLLLRGKEHRFHNAKEAMVIVLRELASSDPSFLERCSRHPDFQGRKRRYIAHTPRELYPDREDLCEMHERLPGNWVVATNLNNVLKMTIIRAASKVAGLVFGEDVVVEF